MKTDPTDPPRIGDGGPETLRAMLRSEQQRGPSDAMVERLSKRLTTAGVLASPGTVPSDAGRAGHRSVAYSKLGLVGLAVVGVALFSWRAMREPSPTSPPAISVAVAQTAPTESADGVAGGEGRPKAIAISVDELPSAVPSARQSAVSSVNAASSAARVSGSPSGFATTPASQASAKSNEESTAEAALTELELVQRAQALLSSDPERALATTYEHARTYPKGQLAQEREVIAVEALAKLGRREEALQRGRALVERFPRTPYAARLEMAVGGPL